MAEDEVGVHLDAANARIRAVMDFSEAVLAEEGELELAPILLIERTVEAQLAIKQCRLPANLVIGQIICRIGRDGAAPVDAARTETA